MPIRPRHVLVAGLGMTASLAAVGCAAFDISGIVNAVATHNLKPDAAQQETNRRRYQKERLPAAMQWLMANSIESGMSLSEVNRVFGEEGRREFNDTWIKTNGGHYRSGDKVHKWGPDSGGRTVYLVFRDGHLVNFDSRDYDTQPAKLL